MVLSHFRFSIMSEHQVFNPEGRDQHRAFNDAHEHIDKADEILAEWPDDLGGRKNHLRARLRTIGRLLDEASTPTIYTDRGFSDQRTNRELRVVIHALDTPAGRRFRDRMRLQSRHGVWIVAPSFFILSPVGARATQVSPTPGEPPELARDSKSRRAGRPRRARTPARPSRGRVSQEGRARAHTLPPPT